MLIRVTEPGKPAFQLRGGEQGLSVFDDEAMDPPLTESEVLANFRPGSHVAARSLAEVHAKGLEVVPVPGAAPLSLRLRDAHMEIRAGQGMTRSQFKEALKELE